MQEISEYPETTINEKISLVLAHISSFTFQFTLSKKDAKGAQRLSDRTKYIDYFENKSNCGAGNDFRKSQTK